MNENFKNILDFLPLVIFFLVYNKTDIFTATLVLVIATLISVSIITFLTKKIPLMPVISAIILSVFGGLTYYLQNPIFIKMKPTIVNIIFSLILFAGTYLKKPLLMYLMGKSFPMPEKAWLQLGTRWAIFFIILAGLNEIIWRNYSENFWVNFKVFGMLPISIAFTLSQIPFMMRNLSDKNFFKK